MSIHPIVVALADLRRAHKLTQQQMADRLHLSRPAVTKFETAHTSHDLAVIERYAAALGAELILKVTP